MQPARENMQPAPKAGKIQPVPSTRKRATGAKRAKKMHQMPSAGQDARMRVGQVKIHCVCLKLLSTGNRKEF